MNRLHHCFLILISLLLTASCGDDPEESTHVYNCVFDSTDKSDNGVIDDEERAIMNDCRNQSLFSKNDIEENLIGAWELIGHGEGWFVSVPEPCGYLMISEDELRLEFTSAYRDTVSFHEWMIEEVINGSGSNFHLRVEPVAHEVAMTVFCESFMYVNNTPVDGNMYLYEKVN